MECSDRLFYLKTRVKALEHPERFELLCAFCHAEHHKVPKSIMDSYPKPTSQSENS